MNPVPTLLAITAAALTGLGTTGCANRPGPYTTADPDRRDTAKAERLTRQAAELIDTEPGQAEQLLREALSADLYHGPAHNNLGVVFLNAGRLYEAAGEFEWARKLMPGHPDPRLNLGIALERGGRVDDAIEAYHSALTTTPEHLPSIQALVSCQLRHQKTNSRTRDFLETIAFAGDPIWREWAQDRLLEQSIVD